MKGCAGRQVLVGVIALGLLGAGCGGSSAPVLSTAQLKGALLTAADAGAGWTQNAREVVTKPSPPYEDQLDQTVCPGAATPKLASLAQAQLELLGPATANGTMAVHEILVSTKDAGSVFGDLTDLYAGCLGTGKAVGNGMTLAVATLDGVPSVGDVSASYLLTYSGAKLSGNILSLVTVARLGTVVMALGYVADPTSVSGSTAPSAYTALVDAAAKRVRAL